MTPPLSRIIGLRGAYEVIDSVYETHSALSLNLFDALARKERLAYRTRKFLIDAGILAPTPGSIVITTFGQRVALLLRALNGKDELASAVRGLEALYPQMRAFDLITHNLTDYVLEAFSSRRDFIRLYICSPWIRLEERQWQKLRAGVAAAQALYPSVQLFVITLPRQQYRDQFAWERTVEEFRRLSAHIAIHRRLHSKLYMSEPGPKGGSHYAVLGSENLTGAGNVELGVKVENHNEILQKLLTYFLEIRAEADPLD